MEAGLFSLLGQSGGQQSSAEAGFATLAQVTIEGAPSNEVFLRLHSARVAHDALPHPALFQQISHSDMHHQRESTSSKPHLEQFPGMPLLHVQPALHTREGAHSLEQLQGVMSAHVSLGSRSEALPAMTLHDSAPSARNSAGAPSTIKALGL